jgi:hypothetical protein
MSVNVNTVYTTVLTILNKEQRGYLSPYEFNNLARQVQLEIFEKYFEDLNQYLRIPQTDVEHSDRTENLDEKINIFRTSGQLIRLSSPKKHYKVPTSDIFSDPVDFYRMGTLSVEGKEIDRLGRSEFYNIKNSPLTAPSLDFPVYLYEKERIFIEPDVDVTVGIDETKIDIDFIRKPVDPKWEYTEGDNGVYIYTGSSVDFELHPSEQTEIILKILLYSGVIIKDPSIIQSAMGLIQKQEAEQKS